MGEKSARCNNYTDLADIWNGDISHPVLIYRLLFIPEIAMASVGYVKNRNSHAATTAAIWLKFRDEINDSLDYHIITFYPGKYHVYRKICVKSKYTRGKFSSHHYYRLDLNLKWL